MNSSLPPRGHVWMPQLNAYVVPIKRKNAKRPSPNHVYCSEPLCWVLMEDLPAPIQ